MKSLFDGIRRLVSRRMFILLLILAQIAFLIAMLMRSFRLHWLVVLLNVISILTALHLLTRPDQKPFKNSLIFLILLFPLFGGAFYWIFHFQTTSVGFRKTLKQIEEKAKGAYAASPERLRDARGKLRDHQKIITYLQNTAGFPIYRNTEACYFSSGKEMLTPLLEDLKSAKHYIFFEFFIMERGRMWDAILEILEQKAREGVDVRVVYDDLGCFLTLPPNYAKSLEKRGIQCRVFNRFQPFLTSLQNNRDHRKIAVIDGRIAYTGGVNLADEYIGEKIRFGLWKDSAIRLQGEGAWSFTVMFLQIWGLLSKKEEAYADYAPLPSLYTKGGGWVQPYSDSPIDGETVGEYVYMQMIEHAKEYLYITTPYFMVDDSMLSALKRAAASGVDVRIVTPGIPDKKPVHFTTRSYYKDLLKAGVRVYEFEKGFLHAKLFLSDDTMATVGTVNLDFRSLYLHFECGVCLYLTPAIEEIKKDFFSTLEQCREITPEDCKAGPLKRLWQSIARLFAPLM
ncbi:MAG: cardiolipin synthase [Clostridia bacterium]|nr:cardiolipin synthase [Clostridia bacterium]